VLHADTLLPNDPVAVMRRVLADPGTALAGFTPLLSGPDQVHCGTRFHNWIKTWYAPPWCSGRNSSCAGCGCYSATTPCFFAAPISWLSAAATPPTLLVMEGSQPPDGRNHRRADPVASGTGSSNPACSSRQSVSAVNAEAVREKARTLAAFCGWLGT
jgi:hypothetical protein